jgi:hypothetical protein
MKKILTAIIAAALLAVAAFAQNDQRTLLSTSTKNGVTTTIYVGRIQADPAKDGSIVITVFPAVVLFDSAGNVLSEMLDTAHSFPLVINAQVKATLAALVQAAYTASLPPSS